MTDTKDLSEGRRAKIVAGTTTLIEMEQESENRRVALDQAGQRIKLLELEIDVLKNENIKARDNEAIAIGRSEEDRAQRVQMETFIQLLAKQLIEFIPPAGMRPLPARAGEVGQKAVASALSERRPEGVPAQ